MSKCNLCPLMCSSERPSQTGACGVDGIKIAKYYLHKFEEPCISFSNGSGCVFFCGCSLRCVFCQNFDVSRVKTGKQITVQQLADIFRELEQQGADNINLVNPTHYVKEIIEAFRIYKPSIPVVYNTHGYERLETLQQIDSFVDIYLPDLKFMDNRLSARYTRVANYADYALPAIKFMSGKKTVFDSNGKMLSGCIIRHLILPLAVYDSVNVINFVRSLGDDVYFSLMSQYTPYGDIKQFPELNRKITFREYARAMEEVEKCGLKNVYLQDTESSGEAFIPTWDF